LDAHTRAAGALPALQAVLDTTMPDLLLTRTDRAALTEQLQQLHAALHDTTTPIDPAQIAARTSSAPRRQKDTSAWTMTTPPGSKRRPRSPAAALRCSSAEGGRRSCELSLARTCSLMRAGQAWQPVWTARRHPAGTWPRTCPSWSRNANSQRHTSRGN